MISVSWKLYFDQNVLYFQFSLWIFRSLIAITLHHTYLHYAFSSFSSFFWLRFLYLLQSNLFTGTYKSIYKSIDFFSDKVHPYVLKSGVEIGNILSVLQWRNSGAFILPAAWDQSGTRINGEAIIHSQIQPNGQRAIVFHILEADFYCFDCLSFIWKWH